MEILLETLFTPEFGIGGSGNLAPSTTWAPCGRYEIPPSRGRQAYTEAFLGR
ncbi:hypothetical protein [Mycobacterium lepromatosis]|uniref:hypothetical protein n=1 Tax=Mycobacterium lepromatosis TaxID=480418 RepID=UPI001EDC4B33|nr:hypothetical protein [Mycobacterium lepromatosis]